MPSLYRWVYTHRIRLRHVLLRAGIVLSATTAVVGLFFEDWEAQRFLILYTAPLLLLGPLWMRIRLLEIPEHPSRAMLVDAAVLALAALRMVGIKLLPISGHMLFLTYSLVVTRTAWYRVAAAVFLLGTTVLKLHVWGDVTSWGVGLAVGVMAAAIHLLGRRRQQPI